MRMYLLVAVGLSGCLDPDLTSTPAETPCSCSSARYFIVDDDIAISREAQLAGSAFFKTPPRINDPDGGLALAYFANTPCIEILGVTTVGGNTSVELATESAAEVASKLGLAVPVLGGAASSADRGQPTAAAQFIVDTILKYPGQVEIFVGGPATNIATALELAPEIAHQWKGVHYTGGTVVEDERSWYTDLNTSFDPESVDLLFSSNSDQIHYYPHAVTEASIFTFGDRKELRQAKTPLSEYFFRRTREWIYAQALVNGIPGFYPYDANAAASVLDSSLVSHVFKQRREACRHSGAWLLTVPDGAWSTCESSDLDRSLVHIYSGLDDAEVRRRQIERFAGSPACAPD